MFKTFQISSIDLANWNNHENYKTGRQIINLLKIVNDTSERGSQAYQRIRPEIYKKRRTKITCITGKYFHCFQNESNFKILLYIIIIFFKLLKTTGRNIYNVTDKR